MKKHLFSIILCLGLISSTFQAKAAYGTSFLAGSPFYVTSLYLFKKMITYKCGSGNPVNVDLTPAAYAAGSVISLLAGGLTSVLTYMGLTRQ